MSFSNGKLDPVNPLTTVDSTVRFECNVGYILKGASSRTCLADGTWSGKEPRCDGEPKPKGMIHIRYMFILLRKAPLTMLSLSLI